MFSFWKDEREEADTGSESDETAEMAEMAEMAVAAEQADLDETTDEELDASLSLSFSISCLGSFSGAPLCANSPAGETYHIRKLLNFFSDFYFLFYFSLIIYFLIFLIDYPINLLYQVCSVYIYIYSVQIVPLGYLVNVKINI